MSDKPATILHLPPPPSVNETRRDHAAGNARLHRWHKLADAEVLAAGGMRKLAKIAGPFAATITLDESLRLDLDNGIKALIDYARRVELVRDDSPKYLRRLTVEWGSAPHGCRLTLTPVSS